MISNCKDKSEWNPPVCDAFCEPNCLSGSSEFSKEHVNHGEDVSGNTHNEEPRTGLKFFFTATCSSDEDVDEDGNEYQTYCQCLEAVEHGCNNPSFGINVQEAEDERQEITQ